MQIYKLLNQIHRRTETLVNETANYNPRIDYLWGVMKNGCEKEDRKRGGSFATYREFVRIGRRGFRSRRKVNVEIHGTTQCWAVVLVSFVVTLKHLWAANFCWLRLHLSFFPLSSLYTVLLSVFRTSIIISITKTTKQKIDHNSLVGPINHQED